MASQVAISKDWKKLATTRLSRWRLRRKSICCKCDYERQLMSKFIFCVCSDHFQYDQGHCRGQSWQDYCWSSKIGSNGIHDGYRISPEARRNHSVDNGITWVGQTTGWRHRNRIYHRNFRWIPNGKNTIVSHIGCDVPIAGEPRWWRRKMFVHWYRGHVPTRKTAGREYFASNFHRRNHFKSFHGWRIV